MDNLRTSDNFFYYGQNSLDQETSSDILLLLLQSKRSLLYSRSQNSAGVDDYVNTPNTIALSILLPYDVIVAISKRNTRVGNGQDGTKERRIAASQNLVKVKQKNGEVDVTVLYIPLSNIKTRVQVSNLQGAIGGI